MMENLLSSSSSMIETSSVASQSERASPVTVAEFDGETVLCRVCGDRASGFHYGVHACEGCKGFFRRSIQQKIQYRPCLKNQQCNIQRVNRNRCQYCRLKKCIAVGMSRDAVRFGRVPKKEKARIIEQMQKKNLASQSSELNSLLANDLDFVQSVVTAHRHTCEITQFRACQMRDAALHKQEYINCPANMACPLNNEIGMDTDANRNNLSDFSESFTPAIKSVVDFAKGIPGFVLLNQDDQVTLLKAGTFEVLLVRLACLFDPHSNTMMFTGGKLFKRQPSTMTTNAGFLLDSMFDFAERFNKMCLFDDEIALFSAVVLLSPDRPGLRNVEQVEKVQNKLTEALQNIVNTNHKEDGTLFAKLLMKTTDLRTLNTLHSEKSIAAGQRSHHERKDRQNADDSDMDFQDSLSTRSSRSSPTLSEASHITMTSGYSGDTDAGNIVIGHRLPSDASGHQQVVLRTPYGTFFREEISGFYSMMADQPRRRCNTLDRDTLTRPRLHTIEEGNRRRYTLDRDYINKMVNRLSDRLETRNAMRGDSVPPSISNSTTSSPIQEEGSSPYTASNFKPITVLDAITGRPPTISTRTSPLNGTEALIAAARTGSSPGSPKSRSRSGSFTQDDYTNARPRCYSFHLNSEGRAARMSLQHRLMAAEQGEEWDAQFSTENNPYLSADMRRGSVGASIGLRSHKQSLLVDRPLSYIRGRVELDKRAEVDGHQVIKHLMPDGSVYGLPLTPEMAAQQTGMWHPQPMAMAPPASLPMMQRSREDLARPMDSRSQEWDTPNRNHELLSRDPSKIAINGKGSSPDEIRKDGLETQVLKTPKMVTSAPDKPAIERGSTTMSSTLLSSFLSQDPSAVASPGVSPENKYPFQESKSAVSILPHEKINGTMETFAPTVRSKASSPEVGSSSKTNSLRSSPVSEDSVHETFGHKKFDKFRKDKLHMDSSPITPTDDQTLGIKGKEKLGELTIKEEKMEEDEEVVEEGSEEKELNVDISDLKPERKSSFFENKSPVVSNNSTPSPNSDRPKLSAKEAHPNLLAHLMNSGNATKQTTAASAAMTSGSSVPPAVFPWAVPSQLAHVTYPHLQAQLYKHPFFAPQAAGFPGLMSSPPVTSPASSSSTLPAHTPSFHVSPINLPFSSGSVPSTSPVNLSSQPNSSTDNKLGSNSKEGFHATAVSHLKDKILRKYDSMENLSKISKDSPTPAGSTGSNTSSSGQWSKSNSPTIQINQSSTIDLNRELATKLTLSPSTSSSSPPGIATPTPPLSSSPSTRAQTTQGLMCPYSSHNASPVSSVSILPTPPTLFQSSSSNLQGMHQIPHLLASQELLHTSAPVYHSMLSHQYSSTSAVAAPPPMNHHQTTAAAATSMSPLSDIQQMIARGPTAFDDPEKRIGMPLNLTSRMDEGHILPGSSSKPHSPQNPA